MKFGLMNLNCDVFLLQLVQIESEKFLHRYLIRTQNHGRLIVSSITYGNTVNILYEIRKFPNAYKRKCEVPSLDS